MAAVKTFEELFAELREKAETRPEGSSTVVALERGVHFIGKKVVEEAAEAWMAAEHEGPERAAEEISQLLYQAQVLMIARRQQTSASLIKTCDSPAICFRQTVAGLDRKKPELMKVTGIERAQDGVVAL